eukprot:Nitzschia sp. Nitz4//scaffold382_size14485//7461//8336//NITZ4_008936-RA/size14485-processed-gene-0.27-mRNA-1//-1//CDS//3329549917//7286//frame0
MKSISTTTIFLLLAGVTLVSASGLRSRDTTTSSASSKRMATAEMPTPNQAPASGAHNENNRLMPQASSEVVAHSRPVHVLASTGALDEMKELLEEEPYWIMARDEHGWTPLHEASRGAHIAMIDYLLSKGADLNAQTYTGATPLYSAEKYNGKDSTVVHYLVSLGALRSEAKAKLRGAAAVATTKEEILKQRVPHTLAGKGFMDELNQLADVRGDWVLDVADENGWTPLMEGCRHGHVHVARFLVDRGVDVNALSSEGGSSLYYAQMFNGQDAEIVHYLSSVGGLHQGPQR